MSSSSALVSSLRAKRLSRTDGSEAQWVPPTASQAAPKRPAEPQVRTCARVRAKPRTVLTAPGSFGRGLPVTSEAPKIPRSPPRACVQNGLDQNRARGHRARAGMLSASSTPPGPAETGSLPKAALPLAPCRRSPPSRQQPSSARHSSLRAPLRAPLSQTKVGPRFFLRVPIALPDPGVQRASGYGRLRCASTPSTRRHTLAFPEMRLRVNAIRRMQVYDSGESDWSEAQVAGAGGHPLNGSGGADGHEGARRQKTRRSGVICCCGQASSTRSVKAQLLVRGEARSGDAAVWLLSRVRSA
jgi:hypothetical protein